MRTASALRGALRAVSGCLRGGAVALATAGAALATRLAYRRREIVVVALLAASLLGGYAVQTWHARAPGTLDRLETEPPRLAALARDIHPRPAPARRAPREAGADRPSRAAGGAAARIPAVPPAPVPTPAAPLDLNLATIRELARLPGIGPRLAARIVARREALSGRFESPDDLATVPGLGRGRAAAVVGLVRVAPIPARSAGEAGAPAPETPP